MNANTCGQVQGDMARAGVCLFIYNKVQRDDADDSHVIQVANCHGPDGAMRLMYFNALQDLASCAHSIGTHCGRGVLPILEFELNTATLTA